MNQYEQHQTALDFFYQALEHAQKLFPSYFKKKVPVCLKVVDTRARFGKCITFFSREVEEKEVLQCKNNDIIERCEIEISKYILYSDEEVKRTIIHEIAHYLTPCHNHDTIWLRTANKLGKKWGLEASHYGQREVLVKGLQMLGKKVEPYRYIVKCPTCNITWFHKRKSESVKNPEKYRCSKCKTNLVSETLLEPIYN